MQVNPIIPNVIENHINTKKHISIINRFKKLFNKSQYIVIDLEFNESRKYFNKDYTNKTLISKDILEIFEIIEIGAVVLNHKLKVKDTFQCFIKPQIYSGINPHVSKLTNINQSLLDEQGLLFEKAFILFEKFICKNKNYILCSWDDIDVKVIQDNLKYYNIPQNLIDNAKTLDIQKVFNNNKKVSLKKALNALNIPTDKQFHRANNDAFMTAQVFQKIYNNDLNFAV